jgi:hypothetical protein
MAGNGMFRHPLDMKVNKVSPSANSKTAKSQKTTLMSDPIPEIPATGQTPVFPQTLHTLRPNHDKPMPDPKPKKRDNIFSKSSDLREDRGTREIKTSHNDQTFHAR